MPFNRTDDRILPVLEEISSVIRNGVFYNKTWPACQPFFENFGAPFRSAGFEKVRPHRHTKAEALVNSLGDIDRRIAALDFPAFSEEDRTVVVETLTALKGTLDEALDRVTKGGKALS
jgi:hypothetical protein